MGFCCLAKCCNDAVCIVERDRRESHDSCIIDGEDSALERRAKEAVAMVRTGREACVGKRTKKKKEKRLISIVVVTCRAI